MIKMYECPKCGCLDIRGEVRRNWTVTGKYICAKCRFKGEASEFTNKGEDDVLS